MTKQPLTLYSLISLSILSLVCVLFVYGSGVMNGEENQQSATDLLLKADTYAYKSETYDLGKAISYVEQAYDIDPFSAGPYLTRVYFVNGQHQKSADVGEAYIRNYSEREDFNINIHYLLGLNYGFWNKNRETREKSIHHFDTLLSMKKNRCDNEAVCVGYAPYLDLGWAYFKNGQIEDALTPLKEGYDAFPKNPWITNSYAVVLYNYDNENKETALEILREAERQARKITIEEWINNYSLNNPQEAEESIEQFIQTIQHNRESIEKGEESITDILSIKQAFNDRSRTQHAKGFVFSACGGCGRRTGTDICGRATSCLNFGHGGHGGCSSCSLPQWGGEAPARGDGVSIRTGQTRYVLSQGACYRVQAQFTGANRFLPLKTQSDLESFAGSPEFSITKYNSAGNAVSIGRGVGSSSSFVPGFGPGTGTGTGTSAAR